MNVWQGVTYPSETSSKGFTRKHLLPLTFLPFGSVLGYMGYLSQGKVEQFENQWSEKINQNDRSFQICLLMFYAIKQKDCLIVSR